MKYPCRCNKRDCQARRTLNKHPDAYKRPPRCHRPGCAGLMYLDKGRKRRNPTDRGPVCREDCYPYPHVKYSKHCKHRAEFTMIQSLKNSRHDPHQHHAAPEDPPF